MIAIANYDFRASGTVAKSIEIAVALRDAGVPVELWVVRAHGPLSDRVPQGLPIVETGSGLRLRWRAVDLMANIIGLAIAIRRRRPSLFLCGGNHLLLPSRIASWLSGRRKQMVCGARASNSSQRAGRSRRAIHRDIRLKFGSRDFVVAVSQELADELHAARLKCRIAVIPNGVDLDRIDRLAAAPCDHPYFQQPGGPILAAMGRITHQKGFDTIIDALALLPVEMGARLIIIGAGAHRDVRALYNQATRLGVANRVSFAGYRDNPFAFLARCDLFVSGSRWEGASNALIEALACGLPLAVTDCPTGNREVVLRGPYGTLADIDDPASLAAAITTELAIGRPRSDQSAGARHWAIEHCLAQWVATLRLGRPLA